jgi:hypothetical protein
LGQEIKHQAGLLSARRREKQRRGVLMSRYLETDVTSEHITFQLVSGRKQYLPFVCRIRTEGNSTLILKDRVIQVDI